MQPLPGHGSAFVGIISGHHGVARSGRMIIFDPTKGRKSTAGMVQEIPHRNRPIKEEIKDQLVNGVWPQFIKPTPLNDKYFLVAAKLDPHALWGLYLVDVYDNVTCLMQAEGEGYISPILVRKTKTPPSIPDRVKLNEKEATFFIQDIYEGEGLKGIPRGTVKSLRLHAYEYAYVKTRSDHNWHGIQSGWDIKRMLGTVPVEEDGSVIFKAPANTPISIQPLDKDGVAIQWMRSWVTGQPGEVVSCIGCHEDQNQIAIPKRVIASQKAPSALTLPEGGTRSFTFDLEVQPILDRACIACHNGEGKAFDLRGGKKDKLGYGTSYLNLHPYVHRQGGEGDMVVLQPYEYHPNTSELVRLLKKGHHNVKLTDKEWKTLYNWIDYNAPDKGYFNANVLTDLPYKGFDQIKRRKELTDKYANGAGVDWKKEIADYADYLKKQGPITPVMPEKAAPVKEKTLKVKGWPFGADRIKEMLAKEKETRKVVEIAPGVKVNFVRIPAGEFVMGSYRGEPDAYPTAKVKIDKAFWMAELETTNEQFNVVFPDHDSRFVDQQWKDHVVQGYPANKPEQPVIRVSYNDAMEFCRKLSEKTGLKITLPTEAQWEWACRAGSDQDFWYGDMHADFGKKDNLADKTTLLFAVYGVDPQPIFRRAGRGVHHARRGGPGVEQIFGGGPGHAFLQQQVHGLKAGIGQKAALHGVAPQHGVEGQQAHALMVGHKDRQYGRVFAARQTHGRAVHGLVHAEAAGRPLRGQLAQVATGGLGREHEGHDRGVGSDDHVLAQAGFETQARHAERAVLVIKVGIQGVVTRFGYAPGHAVVAAVLDLAAHGPPAGALQQRAGITGHDQGGHKVFEHGARPRKQHGVAVHAGEQPAQRKPAILRQLPRGDGHKVSQAGFRGQQVVIGGVAAAFVDM